MGFLDKVKNGTVKFFKGIKNFFVKTGRVNGTHCYGCIENIGDFLVYDDHALISALGMDDIVFTKENVLSYSFAGLGRIRKKKATVTYTIMLDDNVVFPDKVRQKNDVKNLNATIFIEKDCAQLLGRGLMEYGNDIYEKCDVYKYPKCIVIVLNLKRKVGDKVEEYQESMQYLDTDIVCIKEKEDQSFVVKFNDEKVLQFTSVNATAYKSIKELQETN